jgi:ribosomal protein S18 acetylase RimI-like enzyme
MVITLPAGKPANGPRPINPNRDFPQLAALLRAVFSEELDPGSKRVFETAADAGFPGLRWRIDPFLARLSPGYVWVEDGAIVGNVTLISTRSPERLIVANVAIEPAYRRRGIARSLMEIVAREASRKGAREIRLQVEEHNAGAVALYRSLGYEQLGTLTTWKKLDSRPYMSDDLPILNTSTNVRKMPRERWREAYELDRAALGKDLYWPDPLPKDAYQHGLLDRLVGFFSGRQVETWMVAEPSGRMSGIASITTEWGRSHQLSIRVSPAWRGQIENALIQHLLHRLRYLPRRRVFLMHDADDAVMNELLPRARFRPDRILMQMRLNIA